MCAARSTLPLPVPRRRLGGGGRRSGSERGIKRSTQESATGVTALARIAGVNIPTNKRVQIGLQYIHGIGSSKAREIVTKVGIPDARRVSQLTDQEGLQIREVIDREYLVEGHLRRGTARIIQRLMSLACSQD